MIENPDLIMETGLFTLAVLSLLVVISLALFAMFLTAGLKLPLPIKSDSDNFYYKDREIWGDAAGWVMLGMAGWVLIVLFVVPFVAGLIGMAIGITPP